MIKTFIKGLIFGTGFILAVGGVGYISFKYHEGSVAREVDTINKRLKLWSALSIEEQISTAESVLIVRFSDGEDNLKLATVSALYSKNSLADTGFKQGELYPKGNYYPLSERENRSATIFLYIDGMDSPVSTWHAYNDNIPAAGNMPIELMIKKFKGG
jgi:hypothetical protein|tara:strand:+ start:131 stop:604 length:474 start_codon:yes stop_codon:yes gene_type:complete